MNVLSERTVSALHASGESVEIAMDLSQKWYVLAIEPGQERIAAAWLYAKGFGIWQPMMPVDRFLRGKKIAGTRSLCPGYVFVFTWPTERNHQRMRSCPGIWDFLRYANGKEAALTDAEVRLLQVSENKAWPLTATVETIGYKKPRRCWRREPKPRTRDIPVQEQDIVVLRCFDALRDVEGLDETGGTVLRSALGLV